MKRLWFSSRIRFTCLLEGVGGLEYRDSLFVFKAENFEAAFQRALLLGERAQQAYLNGEGKRVIWRAKEIMTLDQIQSEELDGAEVFSESFEINSEEAIPFDAHFEPERSKPSQTI